MEEFLKKIKVKWLWIATAVCAVLAVVFWFLMNKTEVEYEEVTARVTSTAVKEVVNKDTHNRTTFYEVKVRYEGKEYDLQNVHSLAGYSEGREVKALLARDQLYANVEGIKSTSPVAVVYFVFLFGTLGLLMLSAVVGSKQKELKNAKAEAKQLEADEPKKH